MLGFSLSSDLRAAWFENYTITQRLVFIDNDAGADAARHAAPHRNARDARQADGRATCPPSSTTRPPPLQRLQAPARRSTCRFRTSSLRELASSKDAAAATFNTQLTPVWEAGQTRGARARRAQQELQREVGGKHSRIGAANRKSTLIVIMLIADRGGGGARLHAAEGA